MAQGRMLKKNISKSEKFAALKSDKARLLYLMMLPHLDVKGRLEANPKLIRGVIIPLLSFGEQAIQKSLIELHNVGLVKLYQTEGKQCLEYTKFSDFQSLRDDREAGSEVPAPPAITELPSNSSRTPVELPLKLSKVKLSLREEKIKHLDFVFLTDEEYQKLEESLGEVNTRKQIEALNGYVGSKGDKYKSHYHTILNWARRDGLIKGSAPPVVHKCFACPNPAQAQIQTGRGEQYICPACADRLDKAPNFKARGGKVILKTRLEPSQLEKMILEQKAER